MPSSLQSGERYSRA